MSDVVGAGDPDRAPRGGLVVGLVAVLIAGGLAVSALRDEPRRQADPPLEPSSSTLSYGPVPPTEPPDSPAQPLIEPAPHETRELRSKVVVTFAGAAHSVDLATGHHDPIATGGAVQSAIRVGGSVVLFGGHGSGDFPPQPEPVYVVDERLRARRITTAGAVIPDADGTGIWATTWSRRGMVTRHVSLRGASGVSWSGGASTVVRAALHGGHLLVADLAKGGIEVWDPARDRRVHREPDVRFLAGSGRRVVWGAGATCPKPCALMWYDFPNDFAQGAYACRCGTVVTPLDAIPDSAAMSPDGRWVALQTTSSGTRVTVCRIGGRCVRPRNAVIHGGGPFGVTWTDDGTLLLATPPAIGRLAAWRPGWNDVRTIPGTHAVEGLAALGS